MPRRKLTAAEYVERYDPEMRVILELAENAARVNLQWANAAALVRRHPDRALTELVDAATILEIVVRIERSDALRRISAASELLDAELPDDESGPPTE